MKDSLQSWYEKEQKREAVEKRILEEAEWYVEYRTSVRDVAKNFGVGKSTVWRDFTKTLKHIDLELYDRVSYLLHYNKIHCVDKMNEANKYRRMRK